MKKVILLTAFIVFSFCFAVNIYAENRITEPEFVPPANELEDKENAPEVVETYIITQTQINNSEAFTYMPQEGEYLVVKYDDGTYSCEAQGPNDLEQDDYVEPGVDQLQESETTEQ